MKKYFSNKQIFKNTLSGWISVLLKGILIIFVIPILINSVGKEGYGLIGLLSAYLGLTTLLDLGLRQALGRELTSEVSNNNHIVFRELSITAFVLYLLIALFLILLTLIFSPKIIEIFNISTSSTPEAIFLIRFYGSLSILFAFILPVFSSGLIAFMRFDIVNNIQIYVSIFFNLLLIILLKLSFFNPLYVWVFTMLMTALTSIIFIYIQYKKKCFGGILSFKNLNIKSLKPLFNLGLDLYILQVSHAISNQSAPFVISYFLGPIGVALYQPAGRMSEFLRPFVLTLNDQLYPLTTKYFNENTKEDLKNILTWGTKYTFMLGILTSLSLYLLSEKFCYFWLYDEIGDDFLITSKIMQCWAIVDLLTYLTGSQMSILLGMKKMKFLVWSQVPTAIFGIIISIYVVGYTNIGIEGILYGAIIVNIIRRPLLIFYTSKVCNLSISVYFISSYLKPIICGIFLLIVTKGYLYYFPINDLFSLVYVAIGIFLIWALMCMIFIINRTDQKKIINFFKS